MKKNTYYLESLGCAKNTVDSTSMAELLQQAGYEGVTIPSQAEIMIVNTCGFIQAARDESLQVLGDLAKKKKNGQTLIAAGCFTERYRQSVAEQVPGIDGILGTRRWMDILNLINAIRQKKNPQETFSYFPEAATVGTDEHGLLRAAVQGKSAYLKIADGCRRSCAFCAIPLIKGKAVSRPMERIIQETVTLQEMGVKELILIAQDTTDYGTDLGIKDGLAKLLEEIVVAAPLIPWIRILYTFPGFAYRHLIELMQTYPQILPYLDMPLQHAHPAVLRRMQRPDQMEWVYKTLQSFRSQLPGIALRSTFIVGYPGETEEEFQTLLDFLKEIRLDHAGAFPYSFEQNTPAEPLGDPIPNEVKQERLQRLMLLQESISLANNQTWVGKTLPVLIEGFQDNYSIGRSYRDAPDIDGLVFIQGKAPIGEIIPVQITDAMTHDLVGIVKKP